MTFALGAKARGAGYRLQGFDSIGSTNEEALRAASDGDRGGFWFAALQQTAGRGRRGRQWQSPHGNLAASLLMVPDADPEATASLGFVAGVAMSRALGMLAPLRLRVGLDGADTLDGAGRIALKWPNDILADGAKLAGILLEAQQRPGGAMAVAIGIGVNVVAAPADLPYPATSLRELGVEAGAEDVFSSLSDAWVEAFSLWDDGRGLPAVLDAWRASAAGLGSEIAVRQDGQVRRGVFETVDERGRLVIRGDNDDLVVITAGDVHFGATASVRV